MAKFSSLIKKANLFCSARDKLRADPNQTFTHFDFRKYVENIVAVLNLTDKEYPKFTLVDLTKVVNKLKDDSSPGADKSLPPKSLEFLLNLINLSFNFSNHSDYRPISLLSFIGKRLISFLASSLTYPRLSTSLACWNYLQT